MAMAAGTAFGHYAIATALALAVVGDSAGQPAPIAVDLPTLPALTPVDLVLDETISSNTHERGARFPIHVAADVAVNDVVVIPAGSAGEGEVVHAARSRVGGKAGELILAARYVVVGDQEIRLRSFGFGAGQGDDHSTAALALAMALGPAIFLVRGGTFVVPQGTLANARTAQDVRFPGAAGSTPVATPEETPR